MDNSLRTVCDAVRKIAAQLKPHLNPVSFVIMTGKGAQGKSTVLKQSGLIQVPLLGEEHARLYYNTQGIILELGENWISNSKTILQNTLKQLNKCNRYLKITGLVLCVDINELISTDPGQLADLKREHLHTLVRMGMNLGYPVDLSIIFTKMDAIAGFLEFYQSEHATDLAKPLGFSLECVNHPTKKMEAFDTQFNALIDQLSQQIIHKIHPARSTLKRTLVREFPLQLASLKTSIQSVLRGIPPKFFNIDALYFTSAEQGGVSCDRINKKIEHEYALVVPDTFAQATNYRAYFVEGALRSILEHCARAPQQENQKQTYLLATAIGIACLSIGLLTYNHLKASRILDEASKELLAYDALDRQTDQRSQALYHLTKASKKLSHIKAGTITLPKVQQLQHALSNGAQSKLQTEFIPQMTQQLEEVITNPSNTPLTRYNALKVYLMLGQSQHLSKEAVLRWFKHHWQSMDQNSYNKNLALLKRSLNQSTRTMVINQQVVSDARNYLNALPSTYLYYSLAKESFPSEKSKIDIEGFNLATHELPVYFSRSHFDTTIQRIPEIGKKLQSEEWVLGRPAEADLNNLLIQAYCFDYVTWWQNFMKKSQPLRYQDYRQGQQLAQMLKQGHAFSRMLQFIQSETHPDLTKENALFNEQIASKFTDINLLSSSTGRELNQRVGELGQFVSTLSVIKDQGKTAFTITKLRFSTTNPTDPVTMLFNQSKQLPEPLGSWSKQIASDAWVILIKDARQYINQQWQQSVYPEYQKAIANRYPFDSSQSSEISLADFNRFFSTHGTLNQFSDEYIKPFLDLSSAEWKPKAVDDFVVPVSTDALEQIIRANIITNMFFPDHNNETKIEFTLQKVDLDPIVSHLEVQIGPNVLNDTQGTESRARFSWPQHDAKLSLDSIEGNHYELAEQGTWALFKLLEKVNVLVDEQDSSMLQILFEINSNSGRYVLKTNHPINPFTPGILNGFALKKELV